MGFEDDVDLVVDSDKEFVVIPEEKEDGSEAHLKIVDINPTTGAPLAVTFETDVIGFEDGVDPFVTKCAPGSEALVVVPLENEDGSMAQILLLELDETTGALMSSVMIDLAFLGFHPDVDGTWTNNPVTPDDLAFLALESEFGDEKGVIAIDVNCDGDDPYGGCVLLSTAGGPPACAEIEFADWLPGLTSAVDPLCYSLGAAFARLILPVSSAVGNDVLLIDFDPNDVVDQPLYTTYTSVKAVNAGGALPTPFPGFEDGVDMLHLTTMCMEENKLLVPVEGPGDVGDLYLLDLDPGLDGEAVWVYSIDGDAAVPIPGYKEGVDLLPMCDLGGEVPYRAAVPVENEAGTDADLLIVNLETGALFSHAEDPTLNPGFTLPGYEIGIEPLRWTPDFLVVPAELNGFARLYKFTPGADLLSWSYSNTYGYVRSVDPIVVPVPVGIPPLFTPVAKPDGS
ncbi:MAG: hypothetical protein L0Z49_07330, partial [Actinobacteria bacterium]|nr:hypothetical protein [Actinomycetota bacterium]